ncbi:Uncharacterised protein [Amycolatopsis camponoti]|uniref:Uncharacterized protein n=2 Tax=Pseudonocardiaceae TaxID=2070 RepID=A0A6I8LPR8_9PSEU|nr:Uncharacterised protein [Amycolatopsis camponoti]
MTASGFVRDCCPGTRLPAMLAAGAGSRNRIPHRGRPPSKGEIMGRLIDRVLTRIVPTAKASACSGTYFCNAAGHPGYWYRFCCPQDGCEWTKVRSSC